jgi:hypothetical protein
MKPATASEPLDQTGRTNPVHCAVCLNTTSTKTPATWRTANGYCACDEHRQTLEQHGTAALTTRRRKGQPV